MLEQLVNKAKNTSSTTWKWVIGCCIAVLVLYATWWLKRRNGEIARLRTERNLLDERYLDMKIQAQREKDKKLAQALQEEADNLYHQVKGREFEIINKEKEYVEAKKRVAEAKDWRQLEAEAKESRT